jgi:hypothetical protein
MRSFCAGFQIVPVARINLQETKMAVQMTKSQLIEKIAAEYEVGKKDVRGVMLAASFPSVQASGPSSALGDLGPSERRKGGSRHSATADHIHLAAAVQFCSLS